MRGLITRWTAWRLMRKYRRAQRLMVRVDRLRDAAERYDRRRSRK